MAAASPDTFSQTLGTFIAELRATFPELTPYIDRAATMNAEQYWAAWRNNLDILAERDFESLVSERRGLLIGPVALTPALWGELSESTQKVIWRYLRTLLLESVMTLKLDTMTGDQTGIIMIILSQERLDAGGAEAEEEVKEMEENASKHLMPLLERLESILGGFVDASGGKGPGASTPAMSFPEIPERLRNGCIARLAAQMAKEFNPADLGIDPKLLEGDNVEEIISRLMELYQSNPSLLIERVSKLSDRVKRQLMGGSLNREQLVAEAQEYIALFKEHPLFKEVIEKLQAFTGEGGLASLFGGGSGSSGAPSERLRAVQERLRRKMEARKAESKK